jgi:hypothetical protein
MSAFLYGRMTAKREAAPQSQLLFDGIEGQQVVVTRSSTTTEAPGLKTYADIFTALVPAEVIAAALFFVSQFTDTKSVPNQPGKSVTVTDWHSLKLAFWGCAAAAIVLYVAGHYQGGTWTAVDFIRMMIPPLAFAGWSMAQTPSTIFDAAIRLGSDTKVLLIVGGGVALGAAAGWLGIQADKQT